MIFAKSKKQAYGSAFLIHETKRIILKLIASFISMLQRDSSYRHLMEDPGSALIVEAFNTWHHYFKGHKHKVFSHFHQLQQTPSVHRCEELELLIGSREPFGTTCSLSSLDSWTFQQVPYSRSTRSSFMGPCRFRFMGTIFHFNSVVPEIS